MPEKVGLGSPFSALGFKVREDLQEAYHRYRKWLSDPGEWWTGTERVTIVKETRRGWDCLLCARKKEALSPKSIAENHLADPPLSGWWSRPFIGSLLTLPGFPNSGSWS